MTLTITEQFLNITMEHDGYIGWKGYDYIDGASHELDATIRVLSTEVESQSNPSYSQSSTPISYVLGKKPDKIKIEGPLCKVDEVDDYLSSISSHRNLNTIYNVFLPCSIITISDASYGGLWIVDTFKIKRDTKNREWILFELIVDKWYKTPGVNG